MNGGGRFRSALYAGYFPRYNRLLAERGFAEPAAAIKAA